MHQHVLYVLTELSSVFLSENEDKCHLKQVQKESTGWAKKPDLFER